MSDTVVYSAIPYEKIKAYNYVSEALARFAARAYKLHVYDFLFLCRYIWGLAPPPPYQKAGYATVAHQKSDQMKMADSVPPPPHSLHEIAATAI